MLRTSTSEWTQFQSGEKDNQNQFFLARLRKFLGRKLSLEVSVSWKKHTAFLIKCFLRVVEVCNVLFSRASDFLCFTCAYLDHPLAQSRCYCFSKSRNRILWSQSFSHSAQNSDLPTPKSKQTRATLMPLPVILTWWKWKLPDSCLHDYFTKAYIIKVLFKPDFLSKEPNFRHLLF